MTHPSTDAYDAGYTEAVDKFCELLMKELRNPQYDTFDELVEGLREQVMKEI